MPASYRRFTYGDQFDPDKYALTDVLELCTGFEPDRYELQDALREKYYAGHGADPEGRNDNSTKMAMNCLLSLKAYRLITMSDTENYAVTDLAKELLSVRNDPQEVHRRFARHILTNLEGLLLARLIENIRARGELVTLEYLGEEMNELGLRIPPNSTYISTMRKWLALAGVFRPSGYEVNWDVIYELLNIDADVIDHLYQLTPEQKHYLLSLVTLGITEFTPSNKIANHTRSVYSIRLTTKNLVKDVLEPLENLGLIETQKTTTGRGAKPHEVRLSERGQNEVLQPLINTLCKITELTSADLNRSFEDVVKDLDHSEIHVRGIALELLAVWIIRLLGLRFSKWRLRHSQSTGGGEVDVMAASDKIIYNRWQIQCKNQRGRVGVEVIAKEVGLTFITHADVVMVVTTSAFAADAINYANQVTDNSRYYIILLEGDDIRKIVEDRTRIVEILNIKARRAFAKKELGLADFDEQPLIEESDRTIQDLEEELIQTQFD